MSDMDDQKDSAYVSPRIERQGTQSVLGLKPRNIVEKWVMAQWSKDTGIQWPFIRESTCPYTRHLNNNESLQSVV